MTIEAEVRADPFRLPPLAPSPTGSLPLSVTCRTARNGGPSARHTVSIDADWTVTTPHDIALERVAAAMGGYLSCLALVDRDIPALRELIQRLGRRLIPPLSREVGGRWTPAAVAPTGCSCTASGFPSASEAAAHVRGVAHVAHEFGVPPRKLERMARVVFDANDTLFFAPPPDVWGASVAVREARGVELLWECGLHPETIVLIHDAVWPGGPALPMWFYLGAMSRRPALAWVARTLSAVPDADVAVWLCWTNAELDHLHPEARTAWLQAGIPRVAIAALADGSYTPIEVARLARATGRSLAAAAIVLAAWHRARCHPKPEDIALLDELDVDRWYQPSPGALDWLESRAARRLTRTQLGLVLAVCGTRAGAMTALSQGIGDPCGAAALLGITSTIPEPERRSASP